MRTCDRGLVMVSGGFDPLHVGHLAMFQAAKRLGRFLLVVVNADEWLIRKKGRPFMPLADRLEILQATRPVDLVAVQRQPSDDSVDADLEYWYPEIFANGGDRRVPAEILEADTCRRLGIRMEFFVGGGKTRSSRDLLEAWCRGQTA